MTTRKCDGENRPTSFDLTMPGETDFISSVGIGLLFHPSEKFSATIYYGYGFEDFGTTSDLQDIAIHFDLIYQPF